MLSRLYRYFANSRLVAYSVVPVFLLCLATPSLAQLGVRNVCPGVTYTYNVNLGEEYDGCTRVIRTADVTGHQSSRRTGGNLEIVWAMDNVPKSIVVSIHQIGERDAQGRCIRTTRDDEITYNFTLKVPLVYPDKPVNVAYGSNNLCVGSVAKISVQPVSAPAPIEYYWQYQVNGGGFVYFTTSSASEIDFPVPAVPHDKSEIQFRVRTQYVACTNIQSDWFYTGTLFANAAPPTLTLGVIDPQICKDAALVRINIAGGDAGTRYLLNYANQTVTNNGDGSQGLVGAGAHDVYIPFDRTRGTVPFTFSYDLAYIVKDENNLDAPAACADHDTFEVTDRSYTLSLTATPTAERCHNTGDGRVDLTSANGTAPFRYTWTSNKDTVTRRTEDLAGIPGDATYTVAVTDKHGCPGTTSAVVVKPTPVVVTSAFMASDHGGFGVSCDIGNTGGIKNDGIITVDASGGTGALQYELTGLVRTVAYQDSARIRNLYADRYTVRVRDSQRCIAAYSSLVDVTSPAPITFDRIGKTDLLCAGIASGTVTVVGADGGMDDLTYAVTGRAFQASPLFENLSAQSYTVTIRDEAGCTRETNVTLDQPAPLVIGAIGSTVQSCVEKTDGMITVQPATGGTGPRLYSLDDVHYITEDTPAVFSGLVSGTYTVYVRDSNRCLITQPYVLGRRAVITGGFSEPQPISCQGRADGALRITAGGGLAPYQYTWSTGATTRDIGGLPAGTYSVTIRDSLTCEQTFTRELQEPARLTADASITDYHGYGVRCTDRADGVIDLTVEGGTAPYRYAWTNGQTQQQARNLAPAAYDVTVTDGHGCEASLHGLTITQPEVLVPVLGTLQNIACHDGSDGTISIAGTGGAGGYNYSIDGMAWQEEGLFTGLTANAYSVRIRDANGCEGLIATTLTAPTKVLLDLVSKTETTCGQANGRAEVLATGGMGNYAYVWYDGSAQSVGQTAAVESLRSGDYQVRVHDGNACEAVLTVIMNDSDGPRIQTTELTGLTCHESDDGVIRIDVTQGAAPYTIAWDIAGQTDVSVTQVTGGEHWVEVYDTKGCRAKEIFDVPFPAPLEIDYILTEPSCHGSADGRLETAATGGNAGVYQYTWDTGTTGTRLDHIGAGTYTVTVVDARSCTGQETIVVADPILFTVDAGGDRTICVGQNVTVRAEEDQATYRWASSAGFASTEREVTLRDPATYTLTVVSARGCEASDSFVIRTSNDLLQADFLLASEAYAGDTVVVVDISWPVPEGITWTLPEGASLVNSGDAYGEIVFAAAGEYDIILNTYLGECVADLTKHITVQGASGGEDAGRTSSPLIATFEVYPNPNNGRFTVAIALREMDVVAHVRMLDVTGSRRFFDAELRGNGEYYYQGSALPAGVYLLVVDAGTETKMKRVVIE